MLLTENLTAKRNVAFHRHLGFLVLKSFRITRCIDAGSPLSSSRGFLLQPCLCALDANQRRERGLLTTVCFTTAEGKGCGLLVTRTQKTLNGTQNTSRVSSCLSFTRKTLRCRDMHDSSHSSTWVLFSESFSPCSPFSPACFPASACDLCF